MTMSSDDRKKYINTRRYGGSVLFDFSEWKEESTGIGLPPDKRNEEEQQNLVAYHSLKTIIESKDKPRKPKIIRPRRRGDLSEGLTSDEKRGVFQVSGLEAVLNKKALGVKSAEGIFTNIRKASPPLSFELEYRKAWKVTQDYLNKNGVRGIECDIYYADSGAINTYDANGFPIEAYVADIARFEIDAKVNKKQYKFIMVAFREMDSFYTITQLFKVDMGKRKDQVLKVDVYKHSKKRNGVTHYPTLVQRRV